MVHLVHLYVITVREKTLTSEADVWPAHITLRLLQGPTSESHPGIIDLKHQTEIKPREYVYRDLSNS